MSVQSAVETILGQARIEPWPYQARIVAKTLGMFVGSHRNGAGEAEPAARHRPGRDRLCRFWPPSTV